MSISLFPYYNQWDKISPLPPFDGIEINGVYVHPITAYVDEFYWLSFLYKLAIPEMGEAYERLLGDCGRNPFIFLRFALEYNNMYSMVDENIPSEGTNSELILFKENEIMKKNESNTQ